MHYNMTNDVFLSYALLRHSMGAEVDMSVFESAGADEWRRVLELAQKQSLVGVTFSAVQSLGIQLEPSLQDEWEELSAAILCRNVILDQECAKMQRKLRKSGFESTVLKGQGIAPLYDAVAESLALCRQSGDIDLWLKGEGSLRARRRRMAGLARRIDPESELRYHHCAVAVFPDTDVELHCTPSFFFSPLKNRRWQRWCDEVAGDQFRDVVQTSGGDAELVVPSVGFNLVYLPVHIYRHLWEEGIGLRQVMDCCVVLRSCESGQARSVAYEMLGSLGMGRFVAGLMWVMEYVFGLDRGHMLCEPDAAEGQFLLNEIMQAGNFGRGDERIDRSHDGSMVWRFLRRCVFNLRLLGHYPSETLWAPLFKLWQFGCRCFMWG